MFRHMITYDSPPDAPPPEQIQLDQRGLLGELTGALEIFRLLGAAPHLWRRRAEGCRQLVMMLPGFKTGTWSMAPLRAWLRAVGHDARPWGLGRNEGDVHASVAQFTPHLRRAVEDAGHPAVLVGWSLGGVVAREMARELPDLVRNVITYGSPCVGGPTHTIAARAYGPKMCRKLAGIMADRDATTPIDVPITAIFSRRDRVVAWPACIDRTSPNVRHIETRSGHVGMGLNPHVWQTIEEAIRTPSPRRVR